MSPVVSVVEHGAIAGVVGASGCVTAGASSVVGSGPIAASGWSPAATDGRPENEQPAARPAKSARRIVRLHRPSAARRQLETVCTWRAALLTCANGKGESSCEEGGEARKGGSGEEAEGRR